MSQTKRLTRKELRGPDEFQTLSARGIEWAQGHGRSVWIAVGAAAAVLIAIAIVVGVIQSRESRAAREFYGASELFKREQWSEALTSFSTIADDLGGTIYGKLARLYAARAALRADQTPRAVELYRAYLANAPESVALEQLARLDLGIALQKSGDATAARSEFERALEIEGPARPLAMLRLASVAEAGGDKAKAIELYRRYLEDEPEGADAEVARVGLIRLGETPPADTRPPLGAPQIQMQ
jgi:tetratricopeptide (TPR) repeat protein